MFAEKNSNERLKKNIKNKKTKKRKRKILILKYWLWITKANSIEYDGTDWRSGDGVGSSKIGARFTDQWTVKFVQIKLFAVLSCKDGRGKDDFAFWCECPTIFFFFCSRWEGEISNFAFVLYFFDSILINRHVKTVKIFARDWNWKHEPGTKYSMINKYVDNHTNLYSFSIRSLPLSSCSLPLSVRLSLSLSRHTYIHTYTHIYIQISYFLF